MLAQIVRAGVKRGSNYRVTASCVKKVLRIWQCGQPTHISAIVNR